MSKQKYFYVPWNKETNEYLPRYCSSTKSIVLEDLDQFYEFWQVDGFKIVKVEFKQIIRKKLK